MRIVPTTIAAAAALCGSTAIALAQAPVEQMTENPMVPAADANYWASLAAGEGAADVPVPAVTAEGAAWLTVDVSGNSLAWTIEYTGMVANDAWISCGMVGDPGVPQGDAFEGLRPRGAVESEFGFVEEGEYESPIEGDASDVSDALIAQIVDGECYVVIQGEGEVVLPGEDEPIGQINGVIEAVEE